MGFFFYVLIYNLIMNNTTTYPIDFVVPYVNNKDQVWRNTYIDYCKSHRLNQKIVELLGQRYGGLTFIYYQFQLVNKNMPWINKIYLLLSNEEQIDKTKIPSNVEIVYHKDFIWNQYLPTFNSTTIEMFLWNIPNLSEHFIYANDDMLPVKPLKPSDFFEDDKIKMEWRNDDFNLSMSMYAYQCHNNCVSLSRILGLTFPKDKMIRPVHSFTPMIRSHCKVAFNLLKCNILPHIRAFRTEYQHNQYIYPLYEYFRYGTIDSDIDFGYTELDKDFNLYHQIVCINAEKRKEYVDQFVREIKLLCE